jgi:tripartite-type tricarboxylate transporter receptor subunit TctC
MISRRSVLGGAATLGVAGRVAAEAWPARPIKLVAPFAPGGGSDFTSRLIAEKMSARLGQTMIVENKPGVGGNLGAEAAIKSPPDGDTYLTISGSYTINSILHKPSFDSLNDIVAIGQFTDEPTVLTVNPALPVKTLKELVELCRREPGKLSYGSSGPGGLVHLGTEFFLDAAGIKATHVPYRGSSAAMPDLMSGRVAFMFDNLPSALPQARAGKVKALAQTCAVRSPSAPDLPAMEEAGFPDFAIEGWYGIFAPARTPRPIVDKLAADINKALKEPDSMERWKSLGFDPIGSTPEVFAERQKADLAYWKRMIDYTGIKVE